MNVKLCLLNQEPEIIFLINTTITKDGPHTKYRILKSKSDIEVPNDLLDLSFCPY